jgi:hypothetical protein
MLRAGINSLLLGSIQLGATAAKHAKVATRAQHSCYLTAHVPQLAALSLVVSHVWCMLLSRGKGLQDMTPDGTVYATCTAPWCFIII